MSLETEIAKAARIMSIYGVPEADMMVIVRLLVDAGVEKCLDEQQRIREEKEALVQAACAVVH